MTTCGFTINILGRGSRSYPCRADQTLLDAALQADVLLPYGCGAGKCSMCATRVIEGRFQRLGTPVNRRLVKPDIIFVCCTRPLTDMVLFYE
jgi:CDP-4-dehydro-6-deoxyglucose reductase